MAGHVDRDKHDEPGVVEAPAAGVPYCGKCGHNLTGATDSSRCPECGAPFVEYLMRGGVWGKRYESPTRMFGLPLLSIASGPMPGEPVGHARGVFAFGDKATGLVAIGGKAVGLVAVGGMAFGGVAVGGMSLGLIGAIGGMAVGALSWGGLSVGLLASGGLAVGFFASGGLAIGVYAMGGAAIGQHIAGPGGTSQELLNMLQRVQWFFGPAQSSVLNLARPPIVIGLIGGLIAGAIGVMAAITHRRADRDPDEGFPVP